MRRKRIAGLVRKLELGVIALIAALAISACSDGGSEAESLKTSEKESSVTEGKTDAGSTAVQESTKEQDASGEQGSAKEQDASREQGTSEAQGTAEEQGTSEVQVPEEGVPENGVDALREKWEARMKFPTQEELDDFHGTDPTLAPYVAAWLSAGYVGRYDEYAIDFKADYVPDFTYCCLGNFLMDYSSLLEDYAEVNTKYGINGYAGFQYRAAGTVPVAIMSIWDVACKDANGNETILRARRVYPGADDNETFTGEGEGVHCLPDYDWKIGKWYRMLLKLDVSEETGNTTIEQQVMDLETGEWTLLSKYDLGARNVAFTYDIAIFLEDYIPSTSGEVRTMEVRNVRVHPEGAADWIPVTSGYFLQNYDHVGSYAFGTENDIFWIISSGIGGKVEELAPATILTVSGGESTSPY